MELKETISALAEQNERFILDLNDAVWGFAEAGMKEHRSADYIAEAMKQQGFKVTQGVSGIPTAFVAEWGEGKPVIGFLGEYDALPGLSQTANVAQHEELACGAYGHGCGHNSLGAGAAGAAVTLRDYLKQAGAQGTVRYYGCPGEEYGSGKAFMARDGKFDDLDACFTWHPTDGNQVVGSRTLACLSVFFTFKGRTSHASATPHLGRSALDACELMSVGVNYLREHMPSDARVHYAYHDAGGIAPNVVQDHVKVHYFVRSPRAADMMALFERVKKVAKGAAMMTETEVEIQIHEAASDYMPNRVLDRVMQQSLEEVGAPLFDESDRALAAQFRKTFSAEEIASFYDGLEESGFSRDLVPADALLCEQVLPYFATEKGMGGSTDVGDASYCAPTSQINVATMALGTPGHSWQLTGQGKSGMAHKGTMTAAKVMALTAAKLLDRPEVLAEAKAELLRKNGGGYVCPIPDDVTPTL